MSQDTLDAGSAGKVVDCVLALRSYNEWKQMSNGNGCYKHIKSPLVMHSANRMHSRPPATVSSHSCRNLDMSAGLDRQPPIEGDKQKPEGFIGFFFLIILSISNTFISTYAYLHLQNLLKMITYLYIVTQVMVTNEDILFCLIRNI